MFATAKISGVLSLLVLALPKAALGETFAIDEALYASFVRYTKFSAAAYADDCPTAPEGASVVKYVDVGGTDTQATLFRDDEAEELVLAFRGTSSLADFVTDFSQDLVAYASEGVDCAECMVHEGFQEAWNSASEEVLSALSTAVEDEPTYNLTITGHSLGASLAVLAAATMSSPAVNMGVSFKTYTFGQPRTGDPAFADYIDSILGPDVLFRVTHENDGVPQTVTTADGYRHHGTEYWETDPAGGANTVRYGVGGGIDWDQRGAFDVFGDFHRESAGWGGECLFRDLRTGEAWDKTRKRKRSRLATALAQVACVLKFGRRSVATTIVRKGGRGYKLEAG
ncbi:alpha/beta-hydrolase [Zalerion maritima]|uniref:Alpha/beta-hydrolase n=1 Tax=Zalerion maritima TaxID=339359 RepID=A0AAD5RT77_9PEZI|nr:alpha/beta-hydrolase [Zalerion maritima]